MLLPGEETELLIPINIRGKEAPPTRTPVAKPPTNQKRCKQKQSRRVNGAADNTERDRHIALPFECHPSSWCNYKCHTPHHAELRRCLGAHGSGCNLSPIAWIPSILEIAYQASCARWRASTRVLSISLLSTKIRWSATFVLLSFCLLCLSGLSVSGLSCLCSACFVLLFFLFDCLDDTFGTTTAKASADLWDTSHDLPVQEER